MASGKAFKFIKLREVVASMKYRPPVDYQTDISRMVQHYGAQVIEEQTDDCVFDQAALKRRLEQLQPTEDAEVISIETVSKA